MAQMMVSITHAKDNADKATIGFVVANAAAASGVETDHLGSGLSHMKVALAHSR